MGQREDSTAARGVQELGYSQTGSGEMLLQGLKRGEQIHYSLGTENCLRASAGAGSATSVSFS